MSVVFLHPAGSADRPAIIVPGALARSDGFARLQRDLTGLVETICERFAGGRLGGQLGGD